MKTKKNTILSIVVTSIYALTIIIYASLLIAEYAGGAKRIENKFNSIAKNLSINARKNNLDSENFTNELLDSINNFDDIERLQIKVDGNLIFSYPNYSENVEEITKSSGLIKNKSETIKTAKGNELVLNAAFYLLKPKSIFYKGFASFVIILITTFILVLFLIIDSNSSKEENSSKNSEDNLVNKKNQNLENAKTDFDDFDKENNFNDETDFYEENISELNLNSSEPKFNEENIFSEEEIQNNSDKEISFEQENQNIEKTNSENSILKNAENSTLENFESETSENFENPISENQNEISMNTNVEFTKEEMEVLNQITSDLTKEAQAESQKNQNLEDKKIDENEQGLFSPITNFCQEKYLLSRLDNELIRAASSEIELSLILIQIPNIDWKTDCGQEICKVIIEMAKFNDFVFNYKDDACAIIQPELNTEKAIELSQKIFRKIKDIFEENALENHTIIGISTRSLRLISANRLLNEAEESLKHAKEEIDSPIVAFRVNPDKYKAYIAKEASI